MSKKVDSYTCCVEASLDKLFRTGFYHLGYLVGRFPYVVLAITLLVLLIFGGVGAMRFKLYTSDVASLYTPTDAGSKVEQDIVTDFFDEDTKPFVVLGVIRSKNSSDMLAPEMLNAVDHLKKFFWANFSVELNGANYTFRDLCGAHCAINTAIDYLSVFDRWRLTYPTMTPYGNTIYLGNHLYDVTTFPNGTMESVHAMCLHFRSTKSDKRKAEVLSLWEAALFQFARTQEFPGSEIFNFTCSSPTILTAEMKRSSWKAMPYFAISFGALLLFTVLSCSSVDPVKSKPWEAFGAVASPCMAVAVSFGILFISEYPLIGLVVVTPFLVLAIGIDDGFLLLHTWRRADDSLDVPERLGYTLAHCGPAVTLTSLTNALSFGMGLMATTPAIRIFCTYTTVCIGMDFLYQVTFFLAIVAIGGYREKSNRNAYCCYVMRKDRTSINTSKWLTKFNYLPQYCSLLCSLAFRVTTLVIVTVYWAISIYGCVKMQSKLSTSKLVADDSPLQDYFQFENEFIMIESISLNIFVNRVPDLTQPNNFANLTAAIVEFETLPNAVGKSSTSIWLLDYLHMVMNFDYWVDEETEETPSDERWPPVQYSNRYLEEFTLEGDGAIGLGNWNDFIHLTGSALNKTLAVEKFVFSTSYKNIRGYKVWGDMLKQWRETAAKHSQFSISVYHTHSFYVDQVSTARSITTRNVLITFLCMAAACVVFIPQLFSLAFAVLSLGSINIGVIGFLYYWDVDLDPISMTTIMMSIGLSVDFVSHVSYQYFCSWSKPDSKQRLLATLSAVAWPLVQAGVSTALSVSVLAINRAYTTGVFVKTVALVVILGLLHGIWLLPVALGTLPDIVCSRPKRATAIGDLKKVTENGAKHMETEVSEISATVKSNLEAIHENSSV